MSAVANAGGRPDSRKDNQTFFLCKAGVLVATAFELPGAILGGLFIGYHFAVANVGARSSLSSATP